MGADNAWWLDVLENGPASRYADFFDIDWHPLDRDARGQGAAAGARRPLRRACSSAASSRLASTPAPARSSCATTSTASRSIRASIRACSTRVARVASALPDAGRSRARERAPRHSAICRRATTRAPTRVPSAARDKECTSGASPRSSPRRRRSRAAIERAVQLVNGTPAEPRAFDAPARAARGAGLPARLLARRRRRDQLPALLRHQRPRGAAHGARERVRGDARAGARPGRGRQDRRAAHRPPRRAATIPAQYFERLQQALCAAASASRSRRSTAAGRRGRSTSSPRRSSPAHEHLPETWARPRHHRLSLRRRRERPVRRSRREVALRTRYGAASPARRATFDGGRVRRASA